MNHCHRWDKSTGGSDFLCFDKRRSEAGLSGSEKIGVNRNAGAYESPSRAPRFPARVDPTRRKTCDFFIGCWLLLRQLTPIARFSARLRSSGFARDSRDSRGPKESSSPLVEFRRVASAALHQIGMR